jgi:chemotaxis protein CheX
MNAATLPAEIRHYISGHLEEVFSTMLSMQLATTATAEPVKFAGERVTGSVGIAGDTITGQVYLHLSAPFAAKGTAAMLGMAIEEISGPAEVNDVIGEVTNMVAGGLKSWLCDSGSACALTTPAVIRGTSFSVMPKPGVEQIFIAFECGADHGLLEIHVRHNS